MRKHIRLLALIFCSVINIDAAEMSNSLALVPAQAPDVSAIEQKRNAEKQHELNCLLVETLVGEREKELKKQKGLEGKDTLELACGEALRLIKEGADINAYLGIGTPLHYASRGHLYPLVRPLLRAGADDTRLMSDGRSFHDCIAPWGDGLKEYQLFVQEDVVPLLMEALPMLPKDLISVIANKMGMTEQDKQLWVAVSEKDHKKIAQLLDSKQQKTAAINVDPNVCAGTHIIGVKSALRLAWQNKDFRSVDMLLASRANPDKTDARSSKSILHCLIDDKTNEQAAYLDTFLPTLLKAGADLNRPTTQDISGIEEGHWVSRFIRRPLFTLAVRKADNDVDFIRLLLRHGKPNLTLCDSRGRTAFDYAKDQPEILALFKEYQENGGKLLSAHVANSNGMPSLDA